jgi:hypothetical protein
MVNDYSAQYLAAQRRDELLREAERDRVARAVAEHAETGRAPRTAGAPQLSLFARIQSAVRGQSTAAPATATGMSMPPAIQR